MTTSLSDRFQAGDTVWQAWAYVDTSGRPRTRIRKATFQPVPGSPLGPLLRFEDGTAEFHFEFPDHRVYATRESAVLHCIRVLADVRWRIEDAIARLQEEPVENRGGPAPGSGTPAGTAPPEVAR